MILCWGVRFQFGRAGTVVFLKCPKFRDGNSCATRGAQCHTSRAKVTADIIVEDARFGMLHISVPGVSYWLIRSNRH